MFCKQTGKCIFFLFVTHKLITLRMCLGSADIKTLATADEFKASGYLSGGDHVYSKRDIKSSPRFGRLVLGRARLSYRDEVGLDASGKDGLLNKKFSGYREYGEERVENSKWTGPDPTNATRQSSHQISVPQNLSRTLKKSAARTESSSNAALERTTVQSDNVSMKGWSLQTNGCTLGEINSRSTDDIKSSESTKYQIGYQSDSAFPGMEEGRLSLAEVTGVLPGPGSPVNEGWLRTMALVQCGYNNMSLTVRKTESPHLMIDQGQTAPLSLSQLPLCGYSVKTTWRDLVFAILYDGCHVRREDGRYVLSLIWRGAPVKMSCPVPPAPVPLSLCCNPFGMTVTVWGSASPADLGVDLGDEWRSLASVAVLCGYIVETNSKKLVISVPFKTCGVTFKDEKYTLSLRTEEKESTLSCPQSSPPSPASPPLLSPSSHPSPDPALLAPPPGPGPIAPAGPPAVPEHPPKLPMFSWHQPHYPAATPPGQNAHGPHPVDSAHVRRGMPILYPQRPPNPHPEGPPLSKLLAYSLNPTPTPRPPQIPVDDPPYAVPALPSHKPPGVRSSPGARTLVPDDCETRDSAPARPPPPPLHPAVGPPAAPSGPPPVPNYYDGMSQLRPHHSQNPSEHFNARMPPVVQVDHQPPYLPHPVPRSRPHSHLNRQQLPPPVDSSHEPHGPIRTPPHFLHLHPHPHGNPSLNQPNAPNPAHHHSNPPFNKAMLPHSVHHHSNHSFHQAMHPHPVYHHSSSSFNPAMPPPPVHHHGDPSFNQAMPPQPVHHHGNPSFNQPKPHYPVHHYGNPSFNQAMRPQPVHHHGNPSFNQPKPHPPVHHHGDPSFNQAMPPHPVHYHGNPSFNQPMPPHPVPLCRAVSHVKTSVTPISLAPPLASAPFPLPSLSCEPNKMAVTLPSAHPASIAVRDRTGGEWIPIGGVDPECSYMLYMGDQGTLTLSSPLPACYSCSLSPYILSLYLRYWDMALEQVQTLDLKCLHSPGSSTQSPTTERPAARKPQVHCAADHMSVRLPPGVWDVFVQDVKGNEIRLLDAPGDCGYAVRQHDSAGTILTLPFACHVTNKGQKPSVGVKILGEHGAQVERLSCPVAAPIYKQDCGFPGDAQHRFGPGCRPNSSPESGPCYPPTHMYMADEGVAQSEESPSSQPDGPMGVQLRIGTDQNYTSYYRKSRMFRNLLGRPLFLELRLVNAPDPSLALLVHYCLAYSTSAQTPWLLIYHSCPYPQRPPLPAPPSPVRKFTVTTFQHLPPGVHFSPEQEVSFWCSTEVCSHAERACTEGCST